LNTVSEPKPVSEPVAPLDVALANAKRLLARKPELAAEQAREILKVVPGLPQARLVLGAALRQGGQASAARPILETLALEQPEAPAVHLELAVARAESGAVSEAIESLRRAINLQPQSPDAWRLLADYLSASGDPAAADQARAHYLKAATHDPRLKAAAAALVANDLPRADALLRSHLALHPTDIAALRMLAEVAGRLRRYADAERFLQRCLELSPSFDAARYNYAMVLNRAAKPSAAREQVERLLEREPNHPGYRNLKAAIFANLGEYAGAIEIYRGGLAVEPHQPMLWLSLGHALKTEGDTAGSIGAYREALVRQPTLGEAWWSLANLKTFRFGDDDVEAMRHALESPALSAEDRLHLHFALGKALEDRAEYELSFGHYARGNQLRRQQHPYLAADNTEFVEASRALFTREFFEARRGWGSAAQDPIFIVGLPRSGSTLLEQILSSHSLVEGTIELPNLPQIAHGLAGPEERPQDFTAAVSVLGPAQVLELAEQYLASTRVHRKRGTPFFIDKMPNNCAYVGLIHLLFPNARIIDARRHPLACGFSAFKQHFSRGQNFTYDLADLGRYYRDYVALMAHIDDVLPGRVHRVIYETLIEQTDSEVHRLLDYCRLPFEEACLRFYENDRPVRTASSEQVRRPIFREGLDHWRHYAPWLGPLEHALGPVLEAYPGIPAARSRPAAMAGAGPESSTNFDPQR
jgi:predicted Zn-dependent protease